MSDPQTDGNVRLILELRRIVAEQKQKLAAQERTIIGQTRQISELRAAIAAMIEPGVPKVLHTRDGVMVLDD